MSNSVLSQLAISLWIAVAATTSAAAIGFPLAWFLARPGWRGRSMLDVAVNMPLVLPPTVVGYYLLRLMGRSGPLGSFFQRSFGIKLVFTPGAAVLASTVMGLPLFVQAVRNSLAGIPKEVREAAQMDGATPWRTLRYIVLPLAAPGIWTGLLLTYARSLGEFGATLMVAGDIPGKTQTLALAIYSAVQAGNNTTAAVLAGLLSAVAGMSMWVVLRWCGRRGTAVDIG